MDSCSDPQNRPLISMSRGGAVAVVALELHHGRAAPAELFSSFVACAAASESSGALSHNTLTPPDGGFSRTRRWANSATARPAVEAGEHADTGSFDALLKQYRIRLGRKGVEAPAQIGGVGRVRDATWKTNRSRAARANARA